MIEPDRFEGSPAGTFRNKEAEDGKKLIQKKWKFKPYRIPTPASRLN